MEFRILSLMTARQVILKVKKKGRQSAAWFQRNWEPSFSCGFEQRIGAAGDGGKWVCDVATIAKRAPAPQPTVL